MQLHIIPAVDIQIKSNRQRRELEQTKILELAASIDQNGLIHPIVVRQADGEYTLVAGERRLKALEHLWFLGAEVHCGKYKIPEGQAPCLFLGEIDPIDAEEIELEENIRREDLSWRERADATARLFTLRGKQAAASGKPAPTATAVAEEASGASEGQARENARQDIMLGQALADPVKAKAIAPATSRKEAYALLKRHEASERSAALATALGPTFSASMHTLLQGDCLSHLPTLPAETFDVILTDPPYGIGADDFSTSGGKTAGGHFYDDSPERWRQLIRFLSRDSIRVAKAQAHLYCFCDIDRFSEAKEAFAETGWRVFRTPLIWINPGAVRAPWPEHGPQRKYQVILYAVKGNRPVTRLYPDYVICGPDPNLGHPAQKPVPLLVDLLRRSVNPGDSVLDPFAGTGSSLVAAHELKCRATGIELDQAAYGIAAKRIGELK